MTHRFVMAQERNKSRKEIICSIAYTSGKRLMSMKRGLILIYLSR